MALNTPVQGIFQTAPGSDVWDTLEGLLDSGVLTVTVSRFLDQYTPVVSHFFRLLVMHQV
jgi:hypothetical protein